MNRAYNVDCMEALKKIPDKYFDLACVDPPYGEANGSFESNCGTRFGGRFGQYKKSSIARTGGGWADKYGKKIVDWDRAPPKKYFDELFRVSKNQIIWGGNYFGLPPNRCFLVWHKTNIPENFTMSMCEYAWCSFNDNAKIFSFSSARKEGCFHTTQKPVALYKWIFNNYAKPGDKILDTHLGSGSSRIAAYDMGFDFIGFEIDKEYFRMEEERFSAHVAQQRIEGWND